MILTVMSKKKLNLKHLASGECFFFIPHRAVAVFIWIAAIVIPTESASITTE
ncbi:Uncharacterised protein [Yersinia bercovieri]|nr:Uncharacterised protein [Yersinia bercovieri]